MAEAKRRKAVMLCPKLSNLTHGYSVFSLSFHYPRYCTLKNAVKSLRLKKKRKKRYVRQSEESLSAKSIRYSFVFIHNSLFLFCSTEKKLLLTNRLRKYFILLFYQIFQGLFNFRRRLGRFPQHLLEKIVHCCTALWNLI